MYNDNIKGKMIEGENEFMTDVFCSIRIILM